MLARRLCPTLDKRLFSSCGSAFSRRLRLKSPEIRPERAPGDRGGPEKVVNIFYTLLYISPCGDYPKMIGYFRRKFPRQVGFGLAGAPSLLFFAPGRRRRELQLFLQRHVSKHAGEGLYTSFQRHESGLSNIKRPIPTRLTSGFCLDTGCNVKQTRRPWKGARLCFSG